jgi:hypothetical protein
VSDLCFQSAIPVPRKAALADPLGDVLRLDGGAEGE